MHFNHPKTIPPAPSLEKLSSTKPVLGAQKVGDQCYLCYKGSLMTKKHVEPQHQLTCFDAHPSAHFSPSLHSTFVESPWQWELTFIYFYLLYRILKPTFPLCLNKVLVLHLSEKAANCCHPLNCNKDLIIVFEKVILSI